MRGGLVVVQYLGTYCVFFLLFSGAFFSGSCSDLTAQVVSSCKHLSKVREVTQYPRDTTTPDMQGSHGRTYRIQAEITGEPMNPGLAATDNSADK
jgi:hypothetical protein